MSTAPQQLSGGDYIVYWTAAPDTSSARCSFVADLASDAVAFKEDIASSPLDSTDLHWGNAWLYALAAGEWRVEVISPCSTWTVQLTSR